MKKNKIIYDIDWWNKKITNQNTIVFFKFQLFQILNYFLYFKKIYKKHNWNLTYIIAFQMISNINFCNCNYFSNFTFSNLFRD